MAVSTNLAPAAPHDSALINLVLSGHDDCFGVLMDRHLAAVRGSIRWMTRSVSDADDIMQEVQLKIWRHLGSFRSESGFRTWMTSVAINEARQFYRKAKRSPLVHDCSELPERTSPSESPLQACVRGEFTEKLKAAVERLPVKQKRVVLLHDLQELSLQETAQALQTTIPAVKSHYFRAKAALSKALPRELEGLSRHSPFPPTRRTCHKALTEIRQLPTIVAS